MARGGGGEKGMEGRIQTQAEGPLPPPTLGLGFASPVNIMLSYGARLSVAGGAKESIREGLKSVETASTKGA